MRVRVRSDVVVVNVGEWVSGGGLSLLCRSVVVACHCRERVVLGVVVGMMGGIVVNHPGCNG